MSGNVWEFPGISGNFREEDYSRSPNKGEQARIGANKAAHQRDIRRLRHYTRSLTCAI